MKEIRLTGYGMASRKVKQPGQNEDGTPALDENNIPVLLDITELVFIAPDRQEMFIIPLTDDYVEAMIAALKPSSVVIPPAGMKL